MCTGLYRSTEKGSPRSSFDPRKSYCEQRESTQETEISGCLVEQRAVRGVLWGVVTSPSLFSDF